jgi:hypothetical protein
MDKVIKPTRPFEPLEPYKDVSAESGTGERLRFEKWRDSRTAKFDEIEEMWMWAAWQAASEITQTPPTEEMELLRACNDSLHSLCASVWKALEPSGEYEGELNLVEFAASIRAERDALQTASEMSQASRERAARKIADIWDSRIARIAERLDSAQNLDRGPFEVEVLAILNESEMEGE